MSAALQPSSPAAAAPQGAPLDDDVGKVKNALRRARYWVQGDERQSVIQAAIEAFGRIANKPSAEAAPVVATPKFKFWYHEVDDSGNFPVSRMHEVVGPGGCYVLWDDIESHLAQRAASVEAQPLARCIHPFVMPLPGESCTSPIIDFGQPIGPNMTIGMEVIGGYMLYSLYAADAPAQPGSGRDAALIGAINELRVCGSTKSSSAPTRYLVDREEVIALFEKGGIA